MAEQPTGRPGQSAPTSLWLRVLYGSWPPLIMVVWAGLSFGLNLPAPTALGLSAMGLGAGLLLISVWLRRRLTTPADDTQLQPASVKVLRFWAVCAFAVGLLGLMLR